MNGVNSTFNGTVYTSKTETHYHYAAPENYNEYLLRVPAKKSAVSIIRIILPEVLSSIPRTSVRENLLRRDGRHSRQVGSIHTTQVHFTAPHSVIYHRTA